VQLFDCFERRRVDAALDKSQEGNRNADLLSESFLRDVARETKATEPPAELDSQAGH
jgi:hypothetical protein